MPMRILASSELLRGRLTNLGKVTTMGYRSNVRIMTTVEGFRRMCELAWQLATEKGLSDSMVLYPKPDELESLPNKRGYVDDYYDLAETYCCFGWDWVKWYKDFNDVSLVEEVLVKAEVEGIPWQFFRTGEDYEDVENRSSENFYETSLPTLYATLDISY